MPNPPSSTDQKIRVLSLSRKKALRLGYESKLKVTDSQGRRLPRILFRWWNADSQGHNSASEIRAGLYKKINSPVPPPFQGPKLKSALLSHLTPEKKLSPFISTFENFLPALNRALKSDKDAFIIIIDLQRLEKDNRKRFPQAHEVIWPIKFVIKQQGFKLKNHYKGNEWLIHGIIGKSAIIQTIRVSNLLTFARSGRVCQMRDVLSYISIQQHAFGLLDKLHVKLPRVNYRTGQLVGMVLDYLQIPDEYKALVARKVMRMMKFDQLESLSRQRSYLKGVYNPECVESDSDSDGLDEFVVDSDEENESSATFEHDSDEEYESDATFWHDSDDEIPDKIRRGAAAVTADLGSDNDDDDESDTTFSSSEMDDEQALVDAQLRATEQEWKKLPSPRKMSRMSHVEVPKIRAEHMAGYKLVRTTTTVETIDLTQDADDQQEEDDDMIEVQPWVQEEKVTIVATATRTRRTMNLTIRSTSEQSTPGPRGLARLRADAEVMEILQFD